MKKATPAKTDATHSKKAAVTTEKNSRVLAVIGQAFFGFTGLTRMYLSSYLIGTLQFVLFLTSLIIFSQPTSTPETFVAATLLMLIMTIIWSIDCISVGMSAMTVTPQPLWTVKYQWTETPVDMLFGRILGGALVVMVPIFLGVWIFAPSMF